MIFTEHDGLVSTHLLLCYRHSYNEPIDFIMSRNEQVEQFGALLKSLLGNKNSPNATYILFSSSIRKSLNRFVDPGLKSTHFHNSHQFIQMMPMKIFISCIVLYMSGQKQNLCLRLCNFLCLPIVIVMSAEQPSRVTEPCHIHLSLWRGMCFSLKSNTYLKQ